MRAIYPTESPRSPYAPEEAVLHVAGSLSQPLGEGYPLNALSGAMQIFAAGGAACRHRRLCIFCAEWSV